MFCSKCGTAHVEANLFCISCGNSLKPTASVSPVARTRSRRVYGTAVRRRRDRPADAVVPSPSTRPPAGAVDERPGSKPGWFEGGAIALKDFLGSRCPDRFSILRCVCDRRDPEAWLSGQPQGPCQKPPHILWTSALVCLSMASLYFCVSFLLWYMKWVFTPGATTARDEATWQYKLLDWAFRLLGFAGA